MYPNIDRVVNRPMIDFMEPLGKGHVLPFYSDASADRNLGFGCVFNTNWIQKLWQLGFIDNCQPSIEFLGLYALVAGILTWASKLANGRYVIFCNNMGVVHMVNSLTSSCRQCMVLLRILVLNNLTFNRKVLVRYINTKRNELSDALSRNQMTHFRKLGPDMNEKPDLILIDIWPIDKFWIK